MKAMNITVTMKSGTEHDMTGEFMENFTPADGSLTIVRCDGDIHFFFNMDSVASIVCYPVKSVKTDMP